MSRPKPPPVRLSELSPGQSGDFFAVLAERTRGVTRDGKPYYLCRFRDTRRTAAAMVWADSGRFEECDTQWREGAFYKIRGTYHESDRYGPQVEIHQIRPATDADRADGFDPGGLVDRSRLDGDAMFAELRTLASEQVADELLRRLVLTLLDRHAEALKRLPATASTRSRAAYWNTPCRSRACA